MKFLLNSQYALRGWEKMPRVLFNIEKNRAIKNLTPAQFIMLKNCDGIQDLEHNDFLQKLLDEKIIIKNDKNKKLKEEQKYHLFSNRYFRAVQWAITGKCNYKCKHCFIAKDLNNYSDEFSTSECLNIVNQIADCGVEEVYITGGEPLLRKDFFEIIDEFIKRNTNISIISSNGALINETFIKKIKERKINPTFFISFDGIGYHDWMRGIKGAEESSINAINLLIDAGFDVVCESCWHKKNINMLIETAELMNKMGVKNFKTIRTAESPRWKLSKEESNSLSFKEYYDACLKLIEEHKKRNWAMDMKLGDFCYVSANSNYYDILPIKSCTNIDINKTILCQKSRSILFISFDGRILPCNPFTAITQTNKCDINFENIKEKSLKEIMSESNYLNYVTSNVKTLFDKNEECRNCKYNKKCLGGCRALAYGFTEDFFGKDISKCEFFKGEYDKKIINLFNKYNFSL